MATSRVTTAIDALGQDSPRRNDAEFYGKLYMALYADATGKADKAISLLEEAIKIEQQTTWLMWPRFI